MMEAVRNGAWAKAGGGPVPPTPRRLAYIEGGDSNTKYIRFSSTKWSVTKLKCRVSFVGDVSSASSSLASCVIASRVNARSFYGFTIASREICAVSGTSFSKLYTDSEGENGIFDIDFDSSMCSIKYNGIERYNGNVGFSSISTGLIMKADGVSYGTGKIRVYGFNIMSSNGDELNLIPYMSSDNEPCMYDEISGQLFRNAGTGTFAYGELSQLGGGSDRLCVRRSYRRLARPSARFCARASRHSQVWEVAA